MATILASVGTAVVGAVVVGWFNQKKSSEPWDPNKYVISAEETPTSTTPVLLTHRDDVDDTPKKETVRLTQTQDPEPQKQPKLSSAGVALLTGMTTRFGGITLTPENTVSFNRLEMETPDQARLNEFALSEIDNSQAKFIVGSDKTIACPFKNSVAISHLDSSDLIDAAHTTPQMERLMLEQAGENKKNIEALRGWNGCTVNIKKIGNYITTDHLPQGDGVLSADGKTLVVNKGFGKGEMLTVESGQKIIIEKSRALSGGGFSMYDCYKGTNLPDRKDEKNDSYESCQSTLIKTFDLQRSVDERDSMYMDKVGRERFKTTQFEKRALALEKKGELTIPPNLERPDVYCDDVARMVRDGFPQKAGTRSDAVSAYSSRSTISLPRDSHYGVLTKKTSHRRHEAVKAHTATHDPIMSITQKERMTQNEGDISTNRPRGYEDKSGLHIGYKDMYDRTDEPRETDHRHVNDTTLLSTSQILNPNKRGGGKTDYKEFNPARTANVRGDKTHRQKEGYMDGGMVIHEVDTGGRKITRKNVRRKDLSLGIYEQIYNEQHSAEKDNTQFTQRNLKLYDVSKPVVKLRQLEHIPGVMHKRGVANLGHDLYDETRPHTVVAKQDFKKDAASKKGVRQDYGHYTNQFGKDNPYNYEYESNATDYRGKSETIQFGRQTGGSKPNVTYNGENRDIAFDFPEEIEPWSAEGKEWSIRKSHDPTQQRYDIYEYEQPGASAMRENSHEERMSNQKATSYINRGLDAENPVTRHRYDADIAGEGKTAKMTNIFSEHRERDAMHLNEGTARYRGKTYTAGIQTATGRVQNDQQVNLFSDTNATEDNYRREWGTFLKGEIAGMGENGYIVTIQNGGKTMKDVPASNIRVRQRETYAVGERIMSNQKTPSGIIQTANADGSYNIQLDSGEVRAGVKFETITTKLVYTLGEQVEVRSRENTVNNRNILNNAPERYDGILRTQVADDGALLTDPRNAENNGNAAEIYNDTAAILQNHVMSQPLYHGSNRPILPHQNTALLTSGVATPQEETGGVVEVEIDTSREISDQKLEKELVPETDDFLQRTNTEMVYPHDLPMDNQGDQKPNDNLTHRPSYHIHSENM